MILVQNKCYALPETLCHKSKNCGTITVILSPLQGLEIMTSLWCNQSKAEYRYENSPLLILHVKSPTAHPQLHLLTHWSFYWKRYLMSLTDSNSERIGAPSHYSFPQ